MVVFSSISHSHPLHLISPFPVCSSPLFFHRSLSALLLLAAARSLPAEWGAAARCSLFTRHALLLT
jgi:hypothetical protein